MPARVYFTDIVRNPLKSAFLSLRKDAGHSAQSAIKFGGNTAFTLNQTGHQIVYETADLIDTRGEVADMLQNWFETEGELDSARRIIDSGLNQAWREIVLGSLLAVTKVDGEERETIAAA